MVFMAYSTAITFRSVEGDEVVISRLHVPAHEKTPYIQSWSNAPIAIQNVMVSVIDFAFNPTISNQAKRIPTMMIVRGMCTTFNL